MRVGYWSNLAFGVNNRRDGRGSGTALIAFADIAGRGSAWNKSSHFVDEDPGVRHRMSELAATPSGGFDAESGRRRITMAWRTGCRRQPARAHGSIGAKRRARTSIQGQTRIKN